MRQYFVYLNDQQQGPFTLEQLAELAITPETDVWTEGMADWQQAGDVAELTPLLQQLEFRRHVAHTPPPHPGEQAQPPITAEPAPAQPAVEPSPAPPEADAPWDVEPAPAPRRNGHKWLVALVCALIVVGVLTLTCPTRDDHKRAMVNATREWVGEKMKSLTEPLGPLAPVLNGLADWLSGRGVDYLIDQNLEVTNYLVCSVGRVMADGKQHTASVGVLGHVFTFDKDDIDRAIVQAIESKLNLDNAPAAPEPQPHPAPPAGVSRDDEPPVIDDPAADTAYLAAPDDEPSMAEEILDSLAATAQREVTKNAKKWVKKHLKHLYDDDN